MNRDRYTDIYIDRYGDKNLYRKSTRLSLVEKNWEKILGI